MYSKIARSREWPIIEHLLDLYGLCDWIINRRFDYYSVSYLRGIFQPDLDIHSDILTFLIRPCIRLKGPIWPGDEHLDSHLRRGFYDLDCALLFKDGFDAVFCYSYLYWNFLCLRNTTSLIIFSFYLPRDILMIANTTKGLVLYVLTHALGLSCRPA